MLEALPEFRAYRALPQIKLNADFRDMFFPKLAPGEPPPVSDKAPAPRWTLDEILDELPGHKLDMTIDYDEPVRLELLTHKDTLPDWVKSLVSWESVF